jgi:ACS family glucarate transporter-like MFS transporter
VSLNPPLPRSVERPTVLRHRVLVALLAITAVNYAQRNAIAPAVTTIADDLDLTLEAVGATMAAFFWAYTLFMVPSGLVAQRIGAKWALVLFAAGWSLAIAACALATSFSALYAGRVAMGALQAGIFPCATLILKVWYPASRRGLATALLTSFMLLGGVAGSFLTGRLLSPVGWRGVFGLYAVPGLVWAAWFAWWFYSRPRDHPGVNQAELEIIAETPHDTACPAPLPVGAASRAAPEAVRLCSPDLPRVGAASRAAPDAGPARLAGPTRRHALVLLALLTIVLICVQQACRAGANRLVDNWLPTYYEQQRGTSKQMAAYLSGFLQALGVVGVVVGGVLSDEVLRRTRSRRAGRNGVALVSLLGSVVLYLFAWPIGNVYLATGVFSLGLFLFSFSSPCAYALTMDVGGRRLALIFSVMNMAGNLGAAAFVEFVPHFVRWGGWDLALGVFVLMHLVAAVCWLVLDPTASLDDALPAPPGVTS